MDFSAFETITELPREITIAELLGRRIFVRLNSFMPKINTVGEVLDWTSYSIKFPENTLLPEQHLISTIEYDINYAENILTLKLAEDTTPLETRAFIQHILTEVTNCLKKNQN